MNYPQWSYTSTANPGQLRQPLTGLVGCEELLDVLISRGDALIQGLEFLGERL